MIDGRFNCRLMAKPLIVSDIFSIITANGEYINEKYDPHASYLCFLMACPSALFAGGGFLGRVVAANTV
jgi:hypothetical protein